MLHNKTHTNNNSQTTNIPAEYKFTDSIKNIQPSYENLMNAINNFSDDFMNERIQPEIEQRDLF